MGGTESRRSERGHRKFVGLFLRKQRPGLLRQKPSYYHVSKTSRHWKECQHSATSRDRISLCAERDSLRQERWVAVQNFRAAIHDLVVLVEASGTDFDFDLAHLRVSATRGACEVARAALELHRAEHGC
jgi:hypothetical protein